MDAPDQHDPLSSTLAAWRVAPRRHPDFRTQVWSRLAAAKLSVPWSAFARRHMAGVAGALALAVAVGAFTGLERARARTASESARLAAAYVQGLDARSMVMR